MALTLEQILIGWSKALKRGSERVFEILALLRNRDSQMSKGINRVYESLCGPWEGGEGRRPGAKGSGLGVRHLAFKFDIRPQFAVQP